MEGRIKTEVEKVLEELKNRRAEERVLWEQRLQKGEEEKKSLAQELNQQLEATRGDLQRKSELSDHLRKELQQTREVLERKTRVEHEEKVQLQNNLSEITAQLKSEREGRKKDLEFFERSLAQRDKSWAEKLAKREAEHKQKIKGLNRLLNDAKKKFEERELITGAELLALRETVDKLKRDLSGEKVKWEERVKGKDGKISALYAQIADREGQIKNERKEKSIREVEFKNLLKEERAKREADLVSKEQELISLRESAREELKEKEKNYQTKLKEIEQIKQDLTGKILELERNQEKQRLDWEQKLVEKEEEYKKLMVEMAEKEKQSQARYEEKSAELERIKSILEGEIGEITSRLEKETEEQSVPVSEATIAEEETEVTPPESPANKEERSIFSIFKHKKEEK